ncbi:MAG: hypothetical protein ACLVEX_02475 [Ruthenibacterium lactatiformans]
MQKEYYAVSDIQLRRILVFSMGVFAIQVSMSRKSTKTIRQSRRDLYVGMSEQDGAAFENIIEHGLSKVEGIVSVVHVERRQEAMYADRTGRRCAVSNIWYLSPATSRHDGFDALRKHSSQSTRRQPWTARKAGRAAGRRSVDAPATEVVLFGIAGLSDADAATLPVWSRRCPLEYISDFLFSENQDRS